MGPDRGGRLGPPAIQVGDFEGGRKAAGCRTWLAPLSCGRRGGCQPGSDAREIMSGALRRRTSGHRHTQSGQERPPSSAPAAAPGVAPGRGSLLPAVSCARVSIGRCNRHKWRRDELLTGRRYARGLPHKLREDVVGYARSVQSVVPKIFRDAGIAETQELRLVRRLGVTVKDLFVTQVLRCSISNTSAHATLARRRRSRSTSRT